MSIFWDRLEKTFREIHGHHWEWHKDVAKIFDIDSRTVLSWQNGREPTFRMLCRISKHFNVSIDYLLGNLEQNYFQVKNQEAEALQRDILSLKEKHAEEIDRLQNHISFSQLQETEETKKIRNEIEGLNALIEFLRAEINLRERTIAEYFRLIDWETIP